MKGPIALKSKWKRYHAWAARYERSFSKYLEWRWSRGDNLRFLHLDMFTTPYKLKVPSKRFRVLKAANRIICPTTNFHKLQILIKRQRERGTHLKALQ